MIKNPFNYQGGKFNLLPEMLMFFPVETTFIDLFGGGGDVSFNVRNDKIIYNDKNMQLVNIFNNLDNNFIFELEEVIKEFNLSKENRECYLKLRKEYNTFVKKDSEITREGALYLYALICHSFNNQIRFNKKREFNLPFGLNRYFNENMKLNLSLFIEKKNKKSIQFLSKSFDSIEIENNSFIYADPPYLITIGGYEDSYGLSWNKELEVKLLNFLDVLDSKGFKFALSNVTEHKGKTNDILKEWSKKYFLKEIKNTYANCNYQTERGISKEVLISNFYIPQLAPTLF